MSKSKLGFNVPFNSQGHIGTGPQTHGKMTNTLTHLMLLYYTERRLNHNLMYNVDHTFSYPSKKFICACVKLSVHADGTEFRGGHVKFMKTAARLTW